MSRRDSDWQPDTVQLGPNEQTSTDDMNDFVMKLGGHDGYTVQAAEMIAHNLRALLPEPTTPKPCELCRGSGYVWDITKPDRPGFAQQLSSPCPNGCSATYTTNAGPVVPEPATPETED